MDLPQITLDGSVFFNFASPVYDFVSLGWEKDHQHTRTEELSHILHVLFHTYIKTEIYIRPKVLYEHKALAKEEKESLSYSQRLSCIKSYVNMSS